MKMEEISDQLDTGEGLSWHLNAVAVCPYAKLCIRGGTRSGSGSCGQPNPVVKQSRKGFSQL